MTQSDKNRLMRRVFEWMEQDCDNEMKVSRFGGLWHLDVDDTIAGGFTFWDAIHKLDERGVFDLEGEGDE